MKQEQEKLFLSALDEHQERLFRICSMYSKDSEDAKDLFQEVLFQIWRSMTSFKGNSAVGTWMFRIALNICLRFKHKDTKIQNRLIRLDSITIANMGSSENSNSENEKLKFLKSCVKELNEADKAIITLYLEELPYKEISTILGLTENHVAVKIKRIKGKLLNCINTKL